MDIFNQDQLAALSVRFGPHAVIESLEAIIGNDASPLGLEMI